MAQDIDLAKDSVTTSESSRFWSTCPKPDATLALPGLSPVYGRPIVARFDGGQLFSDGGILVLHKIEQRLCQSVLNSFQGLECAPGGGQNERIGLTWLC